MSRISKWHCVCMFISYKQTEEFLKTAFSPTDHVLYPQVRLYSRNKELFKVSIFLEDNNQRTEETNGTCE